VRGEKAPCLGAPGVAGARRLGMGLTKAGGYWSFEAILVCRRQRAGTVCSEEKVPACLLCPAVLCAPHHGGGLGPSPLISDGCLGNLLQLFPGI